MPRVPGLISLAAAATAASLLSFAAAAAASVATDEFATESATPVLDAVQATAVPAPGAEATPVPLSVPKATGPRDWTMEYVAGAVVVAYIVCYIVGRAANSKIVSTIGRALRPVMRANFASLEQSGESGTSLNMEAVSGSEFEYWASGRQHCAGLLLTLTLRARQDLFSTISNLVLPTVLPQAAPVQLDTCTIEVPLSASAQGVVFALASAKKLKELQEAEADLKNFGSKTLAGGEYGAPADYTVLTETRELATLICNKEMAAALAELKSRLISLRVTDVADLVSLPTSSMSTKVLQLTFNLPTDAAVCATIVPQVVRAVLYTVDALSTLEVSKETRATVTKAREAYQRKLDAAAALEAAAARKAAKEEADKKAEAERLAGLDRETRRKVEEKNRKKAVAAATQPRKKMVRA